MMDQQFQKYETDVGAYRDYLSNVVKTRDEARNTGNLDNAANREQKEIIDSVAQVQLVIDQYASLVSNNHLIDQIRSYDATIKEYDAHYVDQDTQVITALASKNAQDDHLSVDELKQVFSQQIRKIMSKQVKDMEKHIRSNVAAGIMGSQSKVVDYIMYLSILFAIYFGFIAFKKLQEQKDALVI